jgi:hypothetical protein
LKAVGESDLYPIIFTDPKNVGNFKSAELFVDTQEGAGFNPSTDYFYGGGFVNYNSSDNDVLLGGGGHKPISDFLLKSENLSHDITTVEKTLTLKSTWMDTGISDLETGTYVIQVAVNNNSMSECIWSGTMSWYNGTCSDTETDEIILHRSGKSYGNTIYLRTIMQNSGPLKL